MPSALLTRPLLVAALVAGAGLLARCAAEARRDGDTLAHALLSLAWGIALGTALAVGVFGGGGDA